VTSVTIVDYGLGNLHSVIKALGHRGHDVRVTANDADIRDADRLVLPGVAAFADGMRLLGERHLIEPLREYVTRGRPFLGICLGMQLLLSSSEEFGHHDGLGIIEGRVEELKPGPGVKVPHVGWNSLHPPSPDRWATTILSDVPPLSPVYFVHSFTAVPTNECDRLADTYNGACRIAAAIHRDNIVGCQFHPEKSGSVGLSIVNRFLAL
jgi:glutamine amidotransferase